MPIAINGSGTLTGISVGGLPDGIVDTDMLANNAVASGKLAAGAGGKILQVVQSTLTDVSSTSTKESWIDIPGTDQAGSGSIFCVKITPTAATSKILFTTSINLGSSNANCVGLGLYRDSTALAIGDASTDKLRTTAMFYQSDTNVNENIHMSHLDSPNSTSELTYKVKVYCYNEDAFYINRSGRDHTGVHYDYRTSSSLTVMEVAG